MKNLLFPLGSLAVFLWGGADLPTACPPPACLGQVAGRQAQAGARACPEALSKGSSLAGGAGIPACQKAFVWETRFCFIDNVSLEEVLRTRSGRLFVWVGQGFIPCRFSLG